MSRTGSDSSRIWQDDGTPGSILAFLKILHNFQPSSLNGPEIRARLDKIAGYLIERGETEESLNYSSPKNDDEASEMANAFESVGEAFEGLSNSPAFLKEQRESFERLSINFRSEAYSLREGLPQEPDSDDSSYSPSGSDELDIGELFRDL